MFKNYKNKPPFYIFYHNDHLGTPQKLTASNGSVVWSAKYGSFGEAVVEVETVENNLRYPGQYYDGESGLHYNWWRYYEPGTGRYLRKDPLLSSFIYKKENIPPDRPPATTTTTSF